MKKVINLFLILITIVLGYSLYNSIQDPIAFQEARDKRKDAVVEVLKKIQTAQDIYRVAHDKYANNFDSLTSGLINGKITITKTEPDPKDPENQDKFVHTYTYKNAADSLFVLIGKTNLDSLRYIPYGGGKTFDIDADTIRQQSTLVPVVQVGTRWKDFMGEFGNTKYKKYDKFYDPDKLLKFGDMNSTNTNGNW